MKKIVLLSISLLVLAVGSVSAQYNHPRSRWVHHRGRPQQNVYNNDFNRVKFGIVGGANIANVVNVHNDNFGTDTRVGWNIGASLDIPISYPLSFEGEVLYSQKGFKAAVPSGQFTQRNNFIDVPLLAKITLIPGFNFVVGPQISFLTSTQNVFDNGFTTTVQQQYNHDTDGYNKTLIGGVVGFGIDLNPNVELRGRYTIDLQDNGADGSGIPNYRNQVFQIGLGFKF
jgi:hypothetical protein